MRSIAGLLLAAAALVLSPARAIAGDPAAPDLDKSLAKAHALVDEARWAEAESALRRLFVDFPEDARLKSRIREVEDELKVCMFRKARGPVKGEDLFGAAAKSFSAATRDACLEFSSFGEPLWDVLDDGFRFLNVRFEGTLTVEASMNYRNAEDRLPTFLVCYDIEKRGGYVVTPGYYHADDTSTLRGEPSIAKVASGKRTELANSGNGFPADYDARPPMKITRSGAEISVRVGSAVVAKSSDSTFTSGYLGFRVDAMRTLTIRGRLDKHSFRKMLAERFSVQFAEWEQASYDREKELPAWVRETAEIAPPDMTLCDLPSDAPRDRRAEIVQAVEAAVDGDDEAALLLGLQSTDVPTNTALYLSALSQVFTGGARTASDSLDTLVAAEPDFIPARLFRGIARYMLRRLDESRADLDWVLERRPRSALAHVITAQLAMFEDDVDRAAAGVDRAAAAGVTSEEFEEIRNWVHRAKKGPNLAQRFEHVTDHFIVVSDHSKKVCFDAATLLESMQPVYAAQFRKAPPSTRKSRVYVFSGMQGFLDYTDELNEGLDSNCAGVYLSKLHELVIWIPLDMTDFANTVRHEGFHQYLHRLVDRAPIWFNEGNAEFMGGGGPDGLRNAKRDDAFVAKFLPVRKLVALKPGAFMANAGVCYTQSRYLVDFLRRTKHEKLKSLLADYFTAIAGGLSQDEANAKVLAPVMDLLEAEFKKGL